MVWHHTHKTKQGIMAHPSDGKAWKHFDSINMNFTEEIRNVRLGLYTDGFSPNNSNSTPYSLRLLFIIIYNLPPWMSLKDSYVNMSLVIPRRKSSCQNSDVFLRPLIDELKDLYDDGFKANSTVPSSIGPPLELTGNELYQQVYDIPIIYEGVRYNPKAPKALGFRKTHNRVKKNIFWELPYWRLLFIRHNLDVMHIEKNVFENLFHTVMDTPKSKDNLKARLDLSKIVHESLFKFDNWIRETEHYIEDGELDRRRDALFASWFNTNPKGVFELEEDISEVEDDDNHVGDDFFQENERLICTTDINNHIEPFNLAQGDVEEVPYNIDD
ncbi:putative transposase-associated domain-containing protein [Tanacetum coccineum]